MSPSFTARVRKALAGGGHPQGDRLRVTYCTTNFFEFPAVPLANVIDAQCALSVIFTYFHNDPNDVPDTSTTTHFTVAEPVRVFYRKGRFRSARHILYDVALVRAILRTRPDVVVLEGIDSPYAVLGMVLLRALGVPTILAAHDVIPHSGDRSGIGQIVRWLRITCASHVVVYSRHQQRALKSIYGRDGSLVHLPGASISAAGLSEGNLPREASTLLFFGSIRPNKGLDLLIRAAEIAHRTIPGLRVIVAGHCPDFGPYAQLITVPELFELHVHRIPEADVSALFARAQLLVLPYRDATQSGPAALALSYGCPVLAADVGGLGEYVEDGVTGMLFRAGDVDELARCICALLSDAPRLAAMRSATQERAGKFSPVSCAGELMHAVRIATGSLSAEVP